ncbi:MAG: hypothetical protein V5A84_03775 [Planctomycetota bacterium]
MMGKKTAVVTVVGLAVVGMVVGTAFSGGGGRGAGPEKRKERGRGGGRSRRNRRGRDAQQERGGRRGRAGARQGQQRRPGRGAGQRRGAGRGRRAGRGAGAGRGRPGQQMRSPRAAIQGKMRRLRSRLRMSQQEWQNVAEPMEEVVLLNSYLDPEDSPGMGRAQAASPVLQGRDRLREMVTTRMRLRRALAGQQAGSDQIGSLLRELRQQRERVRSELQQAREELRRELTTRQQAHLVLMGLLD